ncbi:MAG: D-aminoacylase [Pirellulales bacterium]|nr:D-aminoacylase [Pirellulales bacterium]
MAWLNMLAVGVAQQHVADSPGGGQPMFDVLIRGGTLYDGTGGAPYVADVGICGDRIVEIGALADAEAQLVIDAGGLAVAPGFINMLSWANQSLLVDGRSMSDIRQGVTLEVLGEGWSMGPLNRTMQQDMVRAQGDLKFDVRWSTLGEYLEYLVRRGISTNVASFVGAATVRIHVLGYENRAATPRELAAMRGLVRQAMEEGAMGVASALIYAPGTYADTQELVELCKAAAPYGGMYISHLRSEGNRLDEAVEELLTIARQAGVRAEIYHFKAAGRENWHKLPRVIERVERARAEGLEITADMYPYVAGATGLNAAMPPWVQEGGMDRWIARLRDPRTRARVIQEMRTPSDAWENLLLAAGSPEKVLLVGFRHEALKPLSGSTLAEVAKRRGVSPEEAAIQLVIEDHSRVDAIYFLMDEADVRRIMALDWVSFCSDCPSMPNEGVFLRSLPHPRAYGAFARVLGKYVRDEQVLSLPQAIRKLTALPAQTLRLSQRGKLAKDYYADVVVFDPATIADHATYENPHQYATGVLHVLVNGVPVLKDGAHTGAKPGRAIWGPGRK